MPAPQSVVYGAADQLGAGAGPTGGNARRVLALTAIGPPVTGYLGIAAVLALIMATAPGGTFSLSGALLAAGPAWLAGYHVPVAITGHELGVLPLLPTALLLLMVARTAGNAAHRLELTDPRSATRVIGPVTAAHAVFGTVVALLSTGPVTASPVLAFFITGIVAALAATLGVARPCGLLSAALRRADQATETGLRAGVIGALGLAAVGTVVFAIGLAASWSTSVALFRSIAPGVGSGLGMVLLSVGYLPNVLIGTLSFAAGPGFGIGTVAVAQWRFHAGPVPAVPLLAPLPAVEGHWWVFLMLLPAGVGVLVGLACRDVTDQLLARLRAVGVAALVAAVGWLVLAALAGGSLAGGPFDPVTVPAGSLAVSVFLLIAIPGVLTVWLAPRVPDLLAIDDMDDMDDFEDLDDFDDLEEEPAEDEPEEDEADTEPSVS